MSLRRLFALLKGVLPHFVEAVRRPEAGWLIRVGFNALEQCVLKTEEILRNRTWEFAPRCNNLLRRILDRLEKLAEEVINLGSEDRGVEHPSLNKLRFVKDKNIASSLCQVLARSNNTELEESLEKLLGPWIDEFHEIQSLSGLNSESPPGPAKVDSYLRNLRSLLAHYWRCQCQPEVEHRALLLIDTYQPGGETTDTTKGISFDMLIGFPNQNTPPYWQETRVKLSQKRPHFTALEPQEKSAPEPKPLVSLCKCMPTSSVKMQRTQLSLSSRGNELWYDLCSRNGRFEEPPKVIPLTNLLSDNGGWILVPSVIKHMAILFANSLLYLRRSSRCPWIWKKDDIYFLVSKNDVMLRPHILYEPLSTPSLTSNQSMAECHASELVALGILLIELYTQETFEDLVAQDEESQVHLTLTSRAAFLFYKRCIAQDIIRDEACQDYLEVIGRCLSDHAHSSEEAYEDFVTEKLIEPIGAHWQEPEGMILRGDHIGKSRNSENCGLLPIRSLTLSRSFSQNHHEGSESRNPQTDESLNAVKWLNRLDDKIGSLLSRAEAGSSVTKVAILDTGINMDDDLIYACRRQIKCGKDFALGDSREPTEHWKTDMDGHGTCVAGLLLRVAKKAEIYIARISMARNIKNSDTVIKAIEWATKECNVDIINMSFGFPESCQSNKFEMAIREARHRGVIMFAAACNDGANAEIAYPASEAGVICINSTDHHGTPSGFNPTSTLGNNLSILGEALPSPNGPISGNSFATPIAAGIAVAIRDYVHWTHVDGEIGGTARGMVNSSDKMQKILESLAKDHMGFKYLGPHILTDVPALISRNLDRLAPRVD